MKKVFNIVVLFFVIGNSQAQVTIQPDKLTIGQELLPQSVMEINKPALNELLRINSSDPSYKFYTPAGYVASITGKTSSFDFEKNSSNINELITIQNTNYTLSSINFTCLQPIILENDIIINKSLSSNNSYGNSSDFLTSRGVGLSPTWKSLKDNPEEGFSVRKDDNISIVSSYNVSSLVNVFNNTPPETQSINLTTGVFTASSPGLYFMEIIIPKITFPTNAGGRVYLSIFKSDGTREQKSCNFFQNDPSQPQFTSCRVSAKVKLTTGITVSFHIVNGTSGPIEIQNASLPQAERLRINAFKIY